VVLLRPGRGRHPQLGADGGVSPAAAGRRRAGREGREAGACGPQVRRHAVPAATHITHGPTVTPSLYERTTSPKILRAQGCRAGRALTNGLVVLDFGKLAYRPRRGGYGTVTFANRFASNRSLGWAVRSYARGYSQCLPKSSHAHITLALGTSNSDQDVPSTYRAGHLWAKQTAFVGAYLELHHFDYVTAASAASGSCARPTTSPAACMPPAPCPRSTTARWRGSGPSSRARPFTGTASGSSSRG
jgi:hypothetical protein